jgi:membrane AbrB-like protein
MLAPTFWTSRRPGATLARWLILIAASLVLVGILEWARLPAALLLGPMLAAIALSVTGGALKLPGPLFFGAQGVVGAMIASYLPPELFGRMAVDWPVFALGTLSTLAAASALGWLLTRTGALPGTTAIWGSAPGAATIMTLMSESYGADMRLVAFMQYLRVACCAIVATSIAAAFGAKSGGASAVAWFAPTPFWPLAATLALALGGAWAGLKLGVPGGGMLTPMLLALALRLTGLMTVVLPPWLLALAYALVGWAIGMRFTAAVVAHAASVFPKVLGSILALIVVCGAAGAVLSLAAGVDPLTAYLATSPGGADAVAIIAVSTRVDTPFVMAMQIARFFAVMALGPPLARLLSAER